MSTTAVKPLSPIQQKLLKTILKPASLLNTWVYRMSGGKIGGTAGGAPVVLLTTTGRKSGQPRTAPLLYLEDNGNIIVVASQGGMSTNPLWFRNLEAHPEAEIDFVLKRFAEQIEAVTSGDCQVALIRGSVERSGLDAIELWTEDLVVVLAEGHPLASETNPSLEQLADYPLLLPKRSEQILLHRVVERAMKRSGLRLSFGPPVALDHTASAELLNHPECWSILYASTADNTPKTGLVFRSEAQQRLRLPVSAVIDTSAPETAIQRDLIAALAETAPSSASTSVTALPPPASAG